MAFPGAMEKLSHGEATWFAKKVFVMMSDHHHDDRVGFWCPAPKKLLAELDARDS